MMKKFQDKLNRLAGFRVGKAYFFAMISIVLASCAGGEGCGGCDGCDAMVDQPFPPPLYDKTFQDSGHIKITNEGFAAIDTTMREIAIEKLKEQMKDDTDGEKITLCVPTITKNLWFTEISICTHPMPEGKCTDMPTGCALETEISRFNLDLEEGNPPKLIAKITLADINWELPLGGGRCSVRVGGVTPNKNRLTIKIPLALKTKSEEPHRVEIEAGNVELETDSLNVSGEGRPICSALKLFRDPILNQFKNKIPIDKIKDAFCKACPDGQDDECGEGESCSVNADPEKSRNVCYKDGTNPDRDCVPKVLGKEGLLNLGKAISVISEPDPRSHIMAIIADQVRAEVSQTPPKRDLTLALRSGFEPNSIAPCAIDAEAKRPTVTPLDISETLKNGTYPGTSEPFQFAFAYHRSVLNYFMWDFWASGGLCMKLDTNIIDKVGTGTIGMIVRSLSNQLAGNEEAPMRVLTRPTNPPVVTLGRNRISTPNEGKVSIEEPLMTIDIEDFDIEMSAFVKQRWVRAFTLRTNIKVPIAFKIGDGRLQTVMGDPATFLKDITIHNNLILAEDDQTIKEAFETFIPIMLKFAGDDLTNALSKEIEIPETMGIKIVMDQNSIIGIDDNEALGVFFEIEKGGAGGSSRSGIGMVGVGGLGDGSGTVSSDVQGLLVDLKAPKIEMTKPTTGLPRPSVSYDANFALLAANGNSHALKEGEVVEYRSRIDGMSWSNYARTTRGNINVDDILLAVEGDHEVEIEARLVGQPDAQNVESIVKKVHIDYTAPVITFTKDGFSVRDEVSQPTTTSRYRVLATDGRVLQPWTTSRVTSSEEPIVIAGDTGERRVVVEVAADDGFGNVATARQALMLADAATAGSGLYPELGKADKGKKDETDDAGTTSGGCSSSGGGPAGLVVFLLTGLGLLAITRRRKYAKKSALAAVIASSCLFGCDGEEVEKTPSATDGAATCNEYDCAYECAGKDIDLKGACVEDACKCTVKDYLPVGVYGEYNAIGGKSGTQEHVIATYNREYGDLMVQFFSGDQLDDEKWIFVDGLLAKGEDPQPSHHSKGYRYGSSDKGPNAGKYASIYVDDGGVAHIAYQKDGNLWYARVQKDGTSKMAILDSEPNTGVWTQIEKVGDDLFIFYAQSLNDANQSKFRQVKFPIATEVESIGTPTVVDIGVQDMPSPCRETKKEYCNETVGMGAQCVATSGECRKPDFTCPEGCPQGYICVTEEGTKPEVGECKLVYEYVPAYPQYLGGYTQVAQGGGQLLATFYNGWTGLMNTSHYDPAQVSVPFTMAEELGGGVRVRGPYSAPAYDESNGKFAVAYMDVFRNELRYHSATDDDELVAKGRYFNDVGALVDYPVGQGVQLTFFNGKPIIFFQNTLEGSIIVATRADDGTWTLKPVVGPSDNTGFHGFFLDLYNDGTNIWLVEQRVDLRANPEVQKPNVIKYTPE